MTKDKRYRAAQGSDYILPPEQPRRIGPQEVYAISACVMAALLFIVSMLVWCFAP